MKMEKNKNDVFFLTFLESATLGADCPKVTAARVLSSVPTFRIFLLSMWDKSSFFALLLLLL